MSEKKNNVVSFSAVAIKKQEKEKE